MVNNDGSGTKKRRRKRQTLTYKTANEKRKSKATEDDSVDHSTSSTAKSLGDESSVFSAKKPLKDIEDSKKKQPLQRKSVKRPSALQTEKLKSITKIKRHINEPSSHSEKDNKKQNRKTSVRSASTSSQVADDRSKKQSLTRESVKRPSARQTEKLRSIAKIHDGPSTSSHCEKDNKKQNRKTSDRSASTSSKDADDHRKTTTLSHKNPKKTAQTEKKSLTKKGGKRSHDINKNSEINGGESSTPKKAKTLKKAGNESFSKSSTKKTGSRVHTRVTRQRKNSAIPDRIKDVHVTKKTFQKWKPLTKSTKEYTDEVLKAVVLNVMAGRQDGHQEDNEEAASVLATLKNRILERLLDWKAPATQGDYRKMEAQNEKSEEIFNEKSREINVLDKKLEEEQRLLEVGSAEVIELTNKMELCKKELHSLDNEKAHPLIVETKNVLDLPELPPEFFDDNEHVPMEQGIEEDDLCQTLLQMRENVTSLGLTKWMNKLTTLTERLGQEI